MVGGVVFLGGESRGKSKGGVREGRGAQEGHTQWLGASSSWEVRAEGGAKGR